MQAKTVNEFNPYVWLVWGLPALVVIAGIATVFIAFSDPDGLVSDDYYRDGLAINQSKEADNRAVLLQLSADLSRRGNQLQLTLQGQLPFPDFIELKLEHPTRETQDLQWRMTHQSRGHYYAEATTLPSATLEGHWYISLTPIDKVWRLRVEGNLSEAQQLKGSP